MFDKFELKEAVFDFYSNLFEKKYGFSYFMMSKTLNCRPCQKYDNRSLCPAFLNILNIEKRNMQEWWILKKRKEEFRRKRATRIIQRAWRNSEFAYRPDTVLGQNRLRRTMIEEFGMDVTEVNTIIDARIAEIISQWK